MTDRSAHAGTSQGFYGIDTRPGVVIEPVLKILNAQIIDSESSGFEHASILADLDGDGRDELYVASDDQNEVRRYLWSSDGWQKETLLQFDDGLGRFTWNVMPAPVDALPPTGGSSSGETGE